MTRRKSLPALLLAAFVVATLSAAPGRVRLPDLDNNSVDPFAVPAGTKAVVFVFVSVDCPISNRYAPEIQRLHDTFTSRGIAFRIVYPNPAESPAMIRGHLKDYSLPPVALRDPKQELAKLAGATITPEAALFDVQDRRLYLGRIDDRYVNIGLQRPSATQHDLQDALADMLAGRRVRQAVTPAVGCYIADFAR